MSDFIVIKPDRKQAREELRQIKEAKADITASKARAESFLKKHGFLDKQGKLAPRYR